MKYRKTQILKYICAKEHKIDDIFTILMQKPIIYIKQIRQICLKQFMKIIIIWRVSYDIMKKNQ